MPTSIPNVSLRLLMEDVRCFAGKHDIPLTPITLLVGENSSGKTTFLAMLAAALTQEFPAAKGLFHGAPFDLGGFETIATYKGGRYGRADSFAVGLGSARRTSERKVYATFKQRFGQTELAAFSVEKGGESVRVTLEEDLFKGSATLETTNGVCETIRFEKPVMVDRDVDLWFQVSRVLLSELPRSSKQSESDKPPRAFERLFELLYGGRSTKAVIAIAPVRTKPHRTYDLLSDEFKPEGDHIPYLLSRLRNDPGPKSDRVWEELNRFGVDAGLYRKLSVKKLGQRPSDPFQLRVETSGPSANLPDVGYGISQALPIVVESVLATRGKLLLLQQPEVHLHPRAQAALGSFFVRQASSEKKDFVIETHSDYLVDRIRIEVASGNIDAAQVSILFFDRSEFETKVHQLTLDSNGNILGAPKNFRSFFLKEELRLLSRGA